MNMILTTPIGGASPSRMAAAPDQTPAREGANNVLAALLSTPASITAVTGGQGSDLQSGMGSLENGLQESLFADDNEVSLFLQLKDKTGQLLSPEAKAETVNELATVMMWKLTAVTFDSNNPMP